MSDGRRFMIISHGKVALSPDYSQIFILKIGHIIICRVLAFERQGEMEREKREGERGYSPLMSVGYKDGWSLDYPPLDVALLLLVDDNEVIGVQLDRISHVDTVHL